VPRGSTTFNGHLGDSTIDLSFVSSGLSNRVIRCGIYPELNHDLDYLLIEIVLNLLVLVGPEREQYN